VLRNPGWSRRRYPQQMKAGRLPGQRGQRGSYRPRYRLP
jgi:hypothetical protein